MIRGERTPAPSAKNYTGKADARSRELEAFHSLGQDKLTGTILRGKQGSYSVQGRITEGGMSTIYLATCLDGECSNKKVVIKLTNAQLDLNGGFLKGEGEGLGRVDHRNIMKILDEGVYDDGFADTAFLVLEHLEGETLSQLLQKGGAVSLERACAIFIQLCDALAAVHAAGMIHCDVKPGNIFLTKEAEQGEIAKLFDFGLVMFARKVKPDGILRGTGDYIAPEIMRDEIYDNRVDIYAAGVTMYEMLTGELPFNSDSMYSLLEQVSAGGLPIPLRARKADIPVEVEEMVMRALEKDPAKRFQTAKEMKSAILAVMAASGIMSPGEV